MNPNYDIADRALEIAREAHAGQLDKIGQPYINHPIRVASKFIGPSDDSEILRAIAYLHDVLEETHLTIEDLERAGMPERVLVAVDLLTHQPGETYEAYCRRLRTNEDARLVKLADIDDNSMSWRVEKLDPETRGRLAKKYAKARSILGAA